ncbi:MAG: DUF4143 domain-containing protein [Christensenellales bacterium]
MEKYFKSAGRKVSVDTILNYLSYCEEAFSTYPLKSRDMRSKKFLAANDKYYIFDHGLRLPLLANPLKDIELILKNIVFMESIRRSYRVCVGKANGREIDFVLYKGDEAIYIQVAYILANESAIEREFGVYNLIQDNFKKYVVSMDKADFSQSRIIHKNIEEFLEMEEW